MFGFLHRSSRLLELSPALIHLFDIGMDFIHKPFFQNESSTQQASGYQAFLAYE
jgi:hypothetical protein